MKTSYSIALVVGDEQVMQYVYNKYNFGYWSSAFEVLLEKHGYLSFEKLSFSVLESPEILNSHDAAIISWIPESVQIPKDWISKIHIPLFIEGGPSNRQTEKTLKDELIICDEDIRSKISNKIVLNARKVSTIEKDYDFFGCRDDARRSTIFNETINNICIVTAYTIRNRYQQNGRFEARDDQNHIAALAVERFMEIAEDSSHTNKLKDFFNSTIVEKETSNADNNRLDKDMQTAKNMAAKISDAWLGDIENIIPIFEDQNIHIILLSLLYLKRKTAEKIFMLMKDILYDPECGAFRNIEIVNGQIKKKKGWANNPLVWLTLFKLAKKISINSAADIITETYSRNLLSAWSKTPILKWKLDATDDDIIAKFSNGEPAIIKRGKIFISAFSILSFLVDQHTCHPLKDPFCEADGLSHIHVEDLFFTLLDEILQCSGKPTIKVNPWPFGYDYCLTIRHDVDRIPTDEDFSRLMKYHSENKLGVTFFFLPFRLDNLKIKQIEELGMEIALHSVRCFERDKEINKISSRLSKQNRIFGEAPHGTASDFWLGFPSVQQSQLVNLDYCEMMSSIKRFPYSGFPTLHNDGQVKLLRGIIGITQTASVDFNGMHAAMFVMDRKKILQSAECGFYICLINHPDINFDDLRDIVDSLPKKGRLNWTVKQVADWWKKTHSKDYVNIQKHENSFKLKFVDSVENIAISMIFPYDSKPKKLKVNEEIISFVKTNESEIIFSLSAKAGEELFLQVIC